MKVKLRKSTKNGKWMTFIGSSIPTFFEHSVSEAEISEDVMIVGIKPTRINNVPFYDKPLAYFIRPVISNPVALKPFSFCHRAKGIISDTVIAGKMSKIIKLDFDTPENIWYVNDNILEGLDTIEGLRNGKFEMARV